ncbi:MAG: hypothetical protein KF823_11695 [Xanthomonadales bacterium]|nr:hypothetical protein [Xanthomonadales bacterium]
MTPRIAVVLTALLAAALGASPALAAGTDTAQDAAAAEPPAMKEYWFVMLVRGPRRGEPMPEEEIAALQRGHMAHMAAEHAAGRLLLAGPFGDDGDWRGIQIYDAGGREEVEAICARDPAVAAGRLACDVRPWWSQPGATLK